jgi:hypothetical protein
MKKWILFSVVALLCFKVAGQGQAETFIKEAQDFLKTKEYKQAILSLQDAINDINMMVAKQVADSLPAEINGLKGEGEAEVSAAALGMMGGGLQIIKRYRNETKPENDAEVQIMANSPMLATLNMYLTNPSVLGPGYKSVRVGSNRAIAKTDMQDDGNGNKTRSTEIQIPLGQTLITIRLNGFATEQDELAFATKLKLDKIKEALGE